MVSKIGVMRRLNYIRTAWKRIVIAFPEIEIWLVDVENKKDSEKQAGLNGLSEFLFN